MSSQPSTWLITLNTTASGAHVVSDVSTPPHHMCAITGAPPTKAWTHSMNLRTNGPYGSKKLAVSVNGKQAASTGSAGVRWDPGRGAGDEGGEG